MPYIFTLFLLPLVFYAACASATETKAKAATKRKTPQIVSTKLPDRIKGNQKEKFSGKIPLVLKKVEAKYSKSKSMKANFMQVKFIAALNQKTKSSGSITVKKPGKFIWDTIEPDKNLMVSNGKKFWLYTPPFDKDDNGQVRVANAGDVKTKLLNSLLVGSFSTTRDTDFKKESNWVYTLYPKKGTAGSVLKVKIHVTPESYLIKELELEHLGGNHSTITLANVRLGLKVADSSFNFKIPPRTEILR